MPISIVRLLKIILNIHVLTREEQALFDAIDAKNPFAVREILGANPTINLAVKNSYNRHPLDLAASHDQFEIARLLIEHGASVNSTTKAAGPFHRSVGRPHLSMIVFLLEMGAEINARNEIGRTPFNLAASNNLETCILLMKNGASIDTMDISGDGPLFHAIKSNCLDVVALLVKHTSLREKQLKEAFTLAVSNMHLEMALFLANLLTISLYDMQKLFGWTRLHAAVYNGGFEAVRLCLTTDPALINATEKTESTPLHYAAKLGHAHLIELLLNSGATAGLRNHNRQNSLHLAAQNGHLDIVLLLSGHVDINASGPKGRTPLHLAAQNGHVSVIEALLSMNTHIDKLDNYQDSPLHLAALHGHRDAFELLRARGANTGPHEYCNLIHRVVLRGHNEMAMLLMETPASCEMSTWHWRSLLHIAVLMGQNDLAELLLKRGVDANDANWNRNLLLRISATNGCCAVIRALFSAGGLDVNASDDNGQTLLHYAASNGHVMTVATLCALGANMRARDRSGRTPFLLAARNGHVDVITFYFGAGLRPVPWMVAFRSAVRRMNPSAFAHVSAAWRSRIVHSTQETDPFLTKVES